jgi:hypothetical protein
MNEEGFRRLKAQFDRMYVDHLEKFDSEIAGFAGNDPQRTKKFLAAKDILGHLLAVRKCVEQIMSMKKETVDTGSTQYEHSHALVHALHTQLVKELREFCAQLTRTSQTRLEASL